MFASSSVTEHNDVGTVLLSKKKFSHSYSVLAFEFIEKNYVALIEDETKEM